MATPQDISIYFKSSTVEVIPQEGMLSESVDRFAASFPEWEDAQVAIFGVKEERGSDTNQGVADGPDAIRKYFYQLATHDLPLKIVDLGDIHAGHTVEDTYYAVSQVVEQLAKQQVVPVILGGSQDITFANYSAYEALEQTINLVAIDRKIDLGDGDAPLSASNFLSKIILHQPNYLFNFSLLGYQSYFVSTAQKQLMSELYFDIHRLGEVRAELEEVEPIVRNADVLSIDIAAIRHSDAPGTSAAGPHGFYGEELCQMARYAGLSDKLSSIGFYEVNPHLDNGVTAHLTAHAVWYFLEGVTQRKKDFPIGGKKDFVRYRVSAAHEGHELVFYKSKKSDRWWMDVPFPPNKALSYERHHLVPCSYSDYEQACQSEIPDKWLKAYQKLL